MAATSTPSLRSQAESVENTNKKGKPAEKPKKQHGDHGRFAVDAKRRQPTALGYRGGHERGFSRKKTSVTWPAGKPDDVRLCQGFMVSVP